MESFIGWKRQKRGAISRNLSEPLVRLVMAVSQTCSCEELKGWLPISCNLETKSRLRLRKELLDPIVTRSYKGSAAAKSRWLQFQGLCFCHIVCLDSPLLFILLPTATLPWLQVPDFFSGSWQPLLETIHLSATVLPGISAQDTVQQILGNSYISVKK